MKRRKTRSISTLENNCCHIKRCAQIWIYEVQAAVNLPFSIVETFIPK
jgi:hypothetical protein